MHVYRNTIQKHHNYYYVQFKNSVEEQQYVCMCTETCMQSYVMFFIIVTLYNNDWDLQTIVLSVSIDISYNSVLKVTGYLSIILTVLHSLVGILNNRIGVVLLFRTFLGKIQPAHLILLTWESHWIQLNLLLKSHVQDCTIRLQFCTHVLRSKADKT